VITSRCAISFVRQTDREQAEHVDLARREPEGPVAPARDAVAGRREDGLDGLRVEATRLRVRAQLGRGVVARSCRPVWPGLAHRLVGIRRAEDPRGPRDRAARQRARVAGAVEPLAVLDRDRAERGEGFGLLEHPLGEVGVESDALPFPGAERPAPVPDRVRDAEPAEVVHEAGAPHRRRELGQPLLDDRARGEQALTAMTVPKKESDGAPAFCLTMRLAEGSRGQCWGSMIARSRQLQWRSR
jgi:hypothetical protein